MVPPLEVENCLLLVQHPSVYTLGRGASLNNLKFQPETNSAHMTIRIERGGEVTWHGPGQVVAYPLFDLNKHKRDLHWFTNGLEQTVINLMKRYSLSGERSEVNTGVWVGKNKISAIGVTASRWITMHGIALNVDCDLRNFEQIVPCGIAAPDRGVCSMQSVLEQQCTGAGSVGGLDTAGVAEEWVASFADVFSLETTVVDGAAGSLDALVARHPDIAGLCPERILM